MKATGGRATGSSFRTLLVQATFAQLAVSPGEVAGANDDNIVGTEVEAEEALERLLAEASDEAEADLEVDQELGTALADYVNPDECNDMENTEPIDVEQTDFSLKPHVTFRERLATSDWLREHRPIEIDIDDVRSAEFVKLGMYEWELVPELVTVPKFGTAEDQDAVAGKVITDRPYNGPPPSSHPLDYQTRRVIRGPFDPMRERDGDHVYPEITDLYKNKLDPDISVYLITDEEWEKIREETIHPKRLNAAGGSEYFYPIPIPHDIDLNKVPEPSDDQVAYGVPLKKYLDHPYDWHIFTAPLSSLRQDEVDRIVHIAQTMIRKHKPRMALFHDIWNKFTIRLTAFDHAQEVPRTLREERHALHFYKGRRFLTDFFHRHHKKMRVDKLINDFVEDSLKKFAPGEVERQKRYKEYIHNEQLAEEVKRQEARKKMIDNYRSQWKWYLAPWYILQSMFYAG